MQIISGLAHGQVLQRLGAKGASVILTGTAAADAPLKATISKGGTALKGWKAKPVGQISRGKFSVKLTGLPTGGPYRLCLEAGQARAEIAPFFVGDVWILAGQSNMEGIANMTGRAQPHPLIRAFSMRREWRLAEDPLHLIPESPDSCHTAVQCTPERGEQLRRAAQKGVGVGVFFARDLLKRTGVPQGLICVAHGGTSMKQWDPAQKKLGGASLYGSMLASVTATGQPVAGLLWYQGESDANPQDAPLYTARMQKLVAATRRDLRLPRLPWVIVQIARHFNDQPDARAWNSIQDQQRLLPTKIKFFETVAAIDLSMDDGIHIGAAGYPRLAKRLARAAARLVHGDKRESRPPQLGEIRGGVSIPPTPYVLEVAFDSVSGALRASGEPTGFRLIKAGNLPANQIYKITLDRNKVHLHMDRKPDSGVTLSYGHGFSPFCNITDGRDEALPVFGPIELERRPKALLPFICEWRVSDIVPIDKPLDRVDLPDFAKLGATTRTYPADGFINEHPRWEGQSGHAFFHARLQLPEAMKLDFLMGYDGPFRLWLDGQPFFVDIKGTNPCYPDESSKWVALAAGAHDIHVGMDLNLGKAWGFFLRFARRDVPRARIRDAAFAQPSYSTTS